MKNVATISKNWLGNSEGTRKFLNFQGIDFSILISVLVLVSFGLMMVYSSSFIYAQDKTGDGFYFIKKQILFAIAGFLGLIAAYQVHPMTWKKYSYPILLGTIGVLALVFVPGIGAKAGGAQRWIKFFGVGFQPAELAKFASLLFAARQLALKQNRLDRFSVGIISPFLIAIPAFLLLLLQPDFGSVVMISVTIFFMIYLAGVPRKFIWGSFSVAGGLGLTLALSSSYRRERILTFLDPWRDPAGKGFQIIQSWVGLHNGGLWGVGLGASQEKLFFLPEAHNDFIFAVIGEELGFFGVTGVLLLFLFFGYRGLRLVLSLFEKKADGFYGLLAAGITIAITIQALVNMSVVFGLLPTKGLTLPFISYGGSALIIDLIAIGILLRLSRENTYN